LIDETLAPLDPASKVLVMQKIKSFCHASIVIVIYHNDVADNDTEKLVPEDHFKEDVAQTCVPSNNFFDDNLHVENGYLAKKSLCI
jgi:ABC-type transport system involved in cytochrome bd biosynthesis fused ATPase/permease subunit